MNLNKKILIEKKKNKAKNYSNEQFFVRRGTIKPLIGLG